MRFLMNVATAVSLTLPMTFSVSFAHDDHQPAAMTGEHLNLFERDHAFAGSILNHPMMGVFSHEPFGAQVQIRRGEQTLQLNLVLENDKYQGAINEQRIDEQGQALDITTNIAFVGVKKTGDTSGDIILNIDGTDVVVTVVGETFANNHFHKPTFSTTLNGKDYSFKFTGESCFGYSANIAMMILGTTAHLLK